MKKILIGTIYTEGSNIENEFEESFKSHNVDANIIIKYTETGICKILKEEKIDGLILVEHLKENGESLKVEFLEQIHEDYPNLNIVYIIDSSHGNDDYVKRLFNIGIYNVLYDKDADYSRIVNLILNSRNRKESKLYLNIDNIDIFEDAMEVTNEQMATIIRNLYDEINNEEILFSKYEYIVSKYGENQNTYIANNVPEDLQEALKGNKEFKKYYFEKPENKKEKVEDVQEDNRKFRMPRLHLTKDKSNIQVVEKEVYKDRIIEKEIYRDITPDDYINIVGFLGPGKTGTTTILAAVGQEIMKNKKKVTKIDLTKNNVLHELYCKQDELKGGLEEKRVSSLEMLFKLKKEPFIINKYGNLYSKNKEIDIDMNYSSIIDSFEFLKDDSDVILIDLDINVDKKILKLIQSLYIVVDMNYFNILEMSKFLNEAKSEGVNINKVKLIINKYVKCDLTRKDIENNIKHFKKDKQISKEIDVFTIPFNIDDYIMLIDNINNFKNDYNKLSEEFNKAIKSISNKIFPEIEVSIDRQTGGLLRKLFRK